MAKAKRFNMLEGGKIELMDVMDLRPNPNNTKKHTAKQIDTLCRSMQKVGFNDPIQIDEESMILAGHGRLQAAKKMGLVRVPVIRVIGLTEAEKRAYTISHNTIHDMTGYDQEMLAIEIEALKGADFDLSTLGIDEKEIDKLLNIEDAPPDPLGDAPEDLPGVVQLTKGMALDMSEWVGRYQLPLLRTDRLSEGEPDYTVWIGRNRTTDPGGPLWYLFGSDSTVGMDSSRTTIAFYVDDIRFERLWNELPKWATKFLQAGVKNIVLPDFSCQWDMSRAVHVYSAYRTAFVGRYMQEIGINVIPNVNFTPDPDDLEHWLGAIPENAPCLAWQIQTFAGGSEGEYADIARTMMGLAIEKIKPVRLITYGGIPGLRLGKEICERHNIRNVGIMNRAAAMRGDVAKHEKARQF